MPRSSVHTGRPSLVVLNNDDRLGEQYRRAVQLGLTIDVDEIDRFGPQEPQHPWRVRWFDGRVWANQKVLAALQERLPVSDDLRLPSDVAHRYGQQRDADHQRPQVELEAAAGWGLIGHAVILAGGERTVARRAERGAGNPGRRAGGPDNGLPLVNVSFYRDALVSSRLDDGG
jgi:hypothetical protein